MANCTCAACQVDWREVLRKYIDAVGDAEGVTFIPRDLDSAQYHGFTEDEWHALRELADVVPRD